MEEVTEAQRTQADRQPSAYGLRRRRNLKRRQILCVMSASLNRFLGKQAV
jgi:hypothetical protein